MPEPTPDPTGFPDLAIDHADSSLNLHHDAARHPQTTSFWHAGGDAMHEAGISSGDVLIVDRIIEPQPGDVVVEVVGGAPGRRC